MRFKFPLQLSTTEFKKLQRVRLNFLSVFVACRAYGIHVIEVELLSF